jgi:hypothetical protein
MKYHTLLRTIIIGPFAAMNWLGDLCGEISIELDKRLAKHYGKENK